MLEQDNMLGLAQFVIFSDPITLYFQSLESAGLFYQTRTAYDLDGLIDSFIMQVI